MHRPCLQPPHAEPEGVMWPSLTPIYHLEKYDCDFINIYFLDCTFLSHNNTFSILIEKSTMEFLFKKNPHPNEILFVVEDGLFVCLFSFSIFACAFVDVIVEVGGFGSRRVLAGSTAGLSSFEGFLW